VGGFRQDGVVHSDLLFARDPVKAAALHSEHKDNDGATLFVLALFVGWMGVFVLFRFFGLRFLRGSSRLQGGARGLCSRRRSGEQK
jgi:hypothetical protein